MDLRAEASTNRDSAEYGGPRDGDGDFTPGEHADANEIAGGTARVFRTTYPDCTEEDNSHEQYPDRKCAARRHWRKHGVGESRRAKTKRTYGWFQNALPR